MDSDFRTKEFIDSDNIKICFEGNYLCSENLNIEGNSLASKLLSGYKNWGVALFEKLEYNFAIVIEDKKENKIIMARDRFGLEPLYYTRKGDTYQFSQNIKDLATFEGSINQQKIYEYLNHYSGDSSNIYDTSTFYSQIKSVLPAHYTIITSDSISSTPYWNPVPIHYKESEVFENFGALLKNSVRNTTVSYKKIAAQLSGGFDSSSLAILYSKLGRPITMTIDPKIPESLDGYYLKKVLESIKTEHYNLSPEKDLYTTITEMSNHSGNPDHVILSSSFITPISRKAAELNCDAILSGHDGDTVIGHGYGYLNDLKKQGNWFVFSKMLTEIALNTETSHSYTNWQEIDIEQRSKIIKEKHFGSEIIKLLQSREITKIKKLLADSNREFGYTPLSFIQFLAKKVYHKLLNPRISSNLLLPHSSQKTLGDSLDELYSLNKYSASLQFRSATSKTFIDVNEQLFATGQYYDHAYVFPFMERRLLEFSMSVPDEVKFGGGKTRALLRNALKNDLPPELLERRGKTDFTEYSLKSSKKLWKDNRDKFMSNSEIWNIVDQKKFLKNMELISNPKVTVRIKSSVVRNLNRVMYLSIWLDTLK